jgi:hypothetical protein
MTQSSGATRRGIAESYSAVIARLVRNCALGRAIQYSRGSNDGNDRPRRTGSPGHRRAEATPSFGRLCQAMTGGVLFEN